MGADAGSYAKVVAVNADQNLLTVEIAKGKQLTYDPKRIVGVTVYQQAERKFSARDRVQFTAPQKQLGIANREMGTIEKVDHSGNISLKLDDGRTFEFSPTTQPHFDHGYAVTSHSAQGLTADRVLINADTGSHPDLLNSRFAYVGISRARFDAEIYTNSTADLCEKLANETSKTSALDFNQSTGISSPAELGIGQDM